MLVYDAVFLTRSVLNRLPALAAGSLQLGSSLRFASICQVSYRYDMGKAARGRRRGKLGYFNSGTSH